MNQVILTTLAFVGLLCSAGVAQANYECNGANGLLLAVNEKAISHFGNASILVTLGVEQTQYFGTTRSDEGKLLGKKVIELYPYYQGDVLTIVSKPRSCGRGSCDSDAPVITANLKIGATNTFLLCHETTP